MNQNLLHTPEGVRDIYGEEYSRKLYTEDQIRMTMRSYGYKDIQTPTFEYFDMFSKDIGTTSSRELYKFFDKEGNTLVLRPDFTPSMARCAAKYFMEEDIPIRFCYQGNAFSNTSSLQGKLNEETQMGAELIGDKSVQADAEMIAMLINCLKNCGLKEFQVSIGQIDFFKGICESAGIDRDTELALRMNIGGKNIFAVDDILRESDIDEAFYPVFREMPQLFGGVELLEKAENLANNERSAAAVRNLKKLYELLKVYEVERYVSFDLGMLSKYNYYTGVIFKAYTYGVGDAIVKGGRYDTLLGKFGKDAAAIGFVITVDDLMTALSSQKIELPVKEDNTLIVYEENSFSRALSKAMELRAQGHCVELIPKESGRDIQLMNFARTNKYSKVLFEYDRQ